MPPDPPRGYHLRRVFMRTPLRQILDPPQSVNGPYLFNLFLNDLEITYGSFPALFKNADDSTVVGPVLGNIDSSVALEKESLNWLRDNGRSYNPGKCKELVIKKSNKDIYNPVNCIPQHNELFFFGVTLQSDCKFSSHVKVKLVKANNCVHPYIKNFEKGTI